MIKVWVDRQVLLFLTGEAQLEGLWFGERQEGKPFWWRKYLREALAQPAEADGVERARIMDGLLMWNRRHDKPPITVGHEYGVAGAVLDMVGAALSAVTAERDAFREARNCLVEENTLLYEQIADLTEERDRLRHSQQVLMQSRNAHRDERDQLRAEVEALRPFANEIVSGALDGGSFDGGDIQEMAVQHGLLRSEQREESCGDACGCSEFGFPSECFRKTELLRDAAMAAKEG